MFWLLFSIFLGACVAAGAMGAIFPPGEWYERLEKPDWTPPNWLFPLAWTSLYLLMAAAGARVGALPGNGVALALWSLQIAVNALWTPVFFGLQKLKAGMVVLAVLWLSVVVTTVALWALDIWAGLMFVPYIIWVTIAGALNLSVIRLNPEAAQNG
ncbi:MAG: TspO/MBR family protein [Pseudomonadota bacterium]